MATYGDMINRINDELLLKNEYTTQIQRAIQSAIQLYQKTRFRFNHGRATSTIPPDFEYIEPPPDMIEEDELMLIDGNERRPLVKRTYLWIGNQSRDLSYRARPLFYAIETDDVRLYPIPDQSYELQLSFLKKLPALNANSDSNAWMDDGEELIRLRAKRIILEDVLRGPESFAEADRLKVREEGDPMLGTRGVLGALKDEWKRLAAHDRLEPFDFPGDCTER